MITIQKFFMTDYRKKKGSSKLLPAFLLSFLIFACSQPYGKSVVARVNEQEILLNDLLERLQEYQFDSSLNTPEKNFELKKNVLNELIQEILVSQIADEKKLKTDPKEVQNILTMTYGSNQNQESGDVQKINRAKERITRQIQASNLYKWVTTNLNPPTDEELKIYYDARPSEFVQEEQIRIQQIIVKEKAEAQSVLEELKNDAPFESLVNKYSALPQSTLEGDTGFVGKGMFDPDLEQKIYKLKTGSISPIIQTNQGFHIVKILGKKESKTLEFEEVKDFIYQNLLQQKKEKHYKKWLEQKILQANIERNHAILQQNTPIS